MESALLFQQFSSDKQETSIEWTNDIKSPEIQQNAREARFLNTLWLVSVNGFRVGQGIP